MDKPRRSVFKTLFVLGLIGLVLAAVAVFGAYRYVLGQYSQTPDGPTLEQVYVVKKGQTWNGLAQDLEAKKLIESAFVFKAARKLRGDAAVLKAGEYAIVAPASMESLATTFSEGKTLQYKLTFAEGLTSRQIMRLIAASEILTGDMPETPKEGTLLPETYLFPRGMSRKDLVNDMMDAQDALLEELWAKRDPDLPYKTKREALIMASIVEKETGVSSERDRVAGVFVNRLRRGMLLQTDPTIIYGITGGEPLGRGIRRSELDADTPWNSYKRAGLPPGPICNPGAAAIKAALNPAETKDFYFVADGSGGHAFATNLRDHERNVQNWRKIEREKRRRGRQ